MNTSHPNARAQNLKFGAFLAAMTDWMLTPICLAVLCLGASNAEGAEAFKASDELKPADMSLEQLLDARVERVYGASKYEQKVTQAPSSVSIVTAEEIEKFGHRTLADVLKSVRGLYVSDDRNYSYPGTRGFLRPGDYNTRILMLINGHRMNDNIHDAADIGRDTIDVDLIERVAVIRGPSSSIPIYKQKVFAGIELQYQSKTETLVGRQADDFPIANFTLFSREMVKGLEVSASIYNVFDTRYGHPGAGDHLQTSSRRMAEVFASKRPASFKRNRS